MPTTKDDVRIFLIPDDGFTDDQLIAASANTKGAKLSQLQIKSLHKMAGTEFFDE